MPQARITYKVYGLLMILFVAMSTINYLNTGAVGGSDSYMHFLFAKWAWLHPENFFNHWAKPMFTILSSPFAIFGFKGVVTYNIILTLISGFLSFKIAEKLKFQQAWLAIIFTVFTPILFTNAFSSLTETTFAFVIVLAIYLFVSHKYVFSIVVISFLPFARTEGIIVFPLYIIAYILVKQYRLIPFLLTGFLIMSVAGYPTYQDIGWVLHKIPYGKAPTLYGSGNWSHFIRYSPVLFGWPSILLFMVGLYFGIREIIRNRRSPHAITLFLIFTIAIGYFSAHSLVWALGIGGSAGLTRVMGGISPMVALGAFIGFHYLLKTLPLSSKTIRGLAIIIALVFINAGIPKQTFPLHAKGYHPVLLDAIDYLVQENLQTNYVVYFDPLFAYLYDIDPFANANSSEGFHHKTQPEIVVPEGTIVVWDAHFGPNEGQIPLALLENSKHFKRLKNFQPTPPFTVYTGTPYSVIIFQKINPYNMVN